MEPLLKQLRELPGRFMALSTRVRLAVVGGLAAVVLAALVAVFATESGAYQYAFTNLTAEDSSEAAAVLKGSGISFRTEAGGSALAVPASKVHEVRLLLAASGLPRGGGVGFEIFDRGDLGVSEFTQKVNLRRAIEGELGRTIGRLSPVRSARVHITLPEKGLYRSDERKAAAAVVLNLQPGRSVDERELAGIRHLVSAAVAGLAPENVTVVDGRGTVLAGDRSDGAKLVSEQREMETGLEQRIVDLLEPVVGRGAIVAKVTASLDSREVETNEDSYDPEAQAVRSERKVVEQVASDQNAGGGVAGAAANQPLNPAGGGTAGGSRNSTNREDTLKNYEISKTTTRTVARGPRLLRLSAAVLISGVDGKPRAEAEMRRLGELAKHAVGFDEKRGDRFDISSAPFAIDPNAVEAPLPLWERPAVVRLGVGALLVLMMIGGGFAALMVGRKRQRAAAAAEVKLLKPGSKVSELEDAFTNVAPLPAANVAKLAQAAARAQLGPAVSAAIEQAAGMPQQAGLPAMPGVAGFMPGATGVPGAAEVAQLGADGSIPGSEGFGRGKSAPSEMVLRARRLTETDPQRAAHLLRAWIAMDSEKTEAPKEEKKSA